MNFIVVGSGAVGSYLGARLAAGGQAVCLVARPYQISALADHALRVSDLDGFVADVPSARLGLAADFQSAYAKLTAEQRAQCVILLCVKGGATTAAAQEIARSAQAGAVLISLQNGVENVARIQAAAPQLQVIAGMVPYNIVLKTPQHVHRATAGKLQIAAGEFSQRIAQQWNDAGLATLVAKDIRSVQWGKLIINLNNPINALSNLPLVQELLDRDFRVVLSAMQREALTALACEGIEPAPLMRASPRAMTYLWRLPNFIFKRMAQNLLRVDPSARSSMWDDVQRGRTTEVDDLCGAVVRLAQQHGKSAPVNAKMCELVSQLRKGDAWTGRQLRRVLCC